MRGRLPGDPPPGTTLNGCVALGAMLLLAVGMPIMGLMDGDIFVAVVGPAALTFWLSMKYLLSGHWLRLFRRNNDQ